ncbi:sensor histidine kinase [Pseudobacteriovorax antillogorgiicola]|uniref:histidine kinase n=1 Tax=Pseudobacteriovorax antillogorgiicola TaxID=1513793 RepID=A0A1Y6BF17_9BACT|nr:7TM diverse intracellular signaling domain-containing protein [Pseudobacteriovorax antillogorgiicola]TCS57426.1 7TMR-DISM extracellular protein 2 [Pseudobacteriovorax antillogorgiicola]SMF01238.1 7TMR-DISM extracellular 2 [Pseudobacteriovorax antillogorgiicola]
MGVFRYILILAIASIADYSIGQETILRASINPLKSEPLGISSRPLTASEIQQGEGLGEFRVRSFSSDYLWFKLRIKSESQGSEWFILTKRYLDHVILYYQDHQGQWVKEESGNAIPPANRSIRSRRHGVALSVPSDGIVAYMGLSFGNAASLNNFIIVDHAGLSDKLEEERLIIGLFCGIAFVLFAYNLFFYLSFKDKTFMMYELFVVTSSVSIALAASPLEFYISEAIGPIPGIIRLLQSFVTIVAMVFVYYYLDLKSLGPKRNLLFKILFAAECFVILSYPFLELKTFSVLVHISPIAIIYMIYCTGVKAFRGDRSALIYLFGFGSVSIGVLIKDLYAAGYINNDFIGASAAIFGVAIEMLFMSFAMGYRVRTKITSLFHDLEESRKDLQVKVKQRTAELEERNSELEKEIRLHQEAKEKIKDQQELLIQSEKMSSLGLMAAGIAHEINNPLAIISGYAENIEKRISRPEADQTVIGPMASRIQLTTKRITKIIRGLRVYARNGEEDPFAPHNLGEIIDDVVAIAKERITDTRIDLRYQESDQQLDISCRAEQISQVILNLVNNSIDAIAPKEVRWIDIQIGSSNNMAQLVITDSGLGIPEDIRKRVFDPFFTTKEIGKGTGLGLSISKGIVEDHNGVLEIDDHHPNTRFILCFPLLAAYQKNRPA